MSRRVAPEAIASFLDELARRLVPDCDRGVVRAIFETATSGWTGPQGRDGRRASVLTPSGVPFEVKLSAGGVRPSAALRYSAEAATDQAFFGPRLAAQRTALAELTGWLPGGPAGAAAEIRVFVDAVFPEPAAVPARTRFATLAGVVHQPDRPDGLSGLTVYGNLRGDPAGVKRLAAEWPAFADLVERLDGLTGLVPLFAGLEVGAEGERRAKLYVRSGEDDPGALERLVEWSTAGARPLEEQLADLGIAVRRGAKAFVGCEARNGLAPAVSLYLPASSSHLGDRQTGRVVPDGPWRRRLPATAVEALEASAATSPTAWHCTGLGIGLASSDTPGKLNLYCAPAGLPNLPPK